MTDQNGPSERDGGSGPTGRPVALITGASAGIGRATALAFARAGYDVAGGSRAADRLEAVAADVSGAGAQFLPVVGNVRHAGTARDAVAAVTDRFGRLDVLVNNAAGMFQSSAAELSENGWRAILGSTLDGTWFFCQASYPALRATRGVIVNIASIAGLRPSPKATAYTVAKAGVIALTRALGTEWAPDIRVVGLAPGTVATGGVLQVLSAEGLTQATRQIPAGRLGTPEEVAGVVTFLASAQAAWLTATTVVLDGGQSSVVRLGS